MTQIAVAVPPSLQKYRGHLRLFFEGMIRKLDLNSHKDTPTRPAMETLFALLQGEIEELDTQIKEDQLDTNSLVETQDISNYAFLMFVALRNDGTLTETEKFIVEHLDIRPKEGKVYCRRPRAGSKYKIGEEFKGSNRDGYIDIKMQQGHRRGGLRKISVPRSHLIWWKAKGRWPTGVVDHKDRNRSNDKIGNLKDATFSQNGLNKARVNKYPPFVTRYAPTGREHLQQYGKFVYARSFRGVLVRAAYYDTPEQAARVGKRKWNKMTKDMLCSDA